MNVESFPVGKIEFLDLHPLDFEEFLEGTGDIRSAEIIKNCGADDEIPEIVHSHLWEELKKYLKSEIYDSIGVLLSLRIKIEQLAYEKLSTAQKVQFLETHKTRTKLEYCDYECNLEIPETHYLLGIIYNDDLHWRDGRDYETPLQSKLSNPTIKRMIEAIADTPINQAGECTAENSTSSEAA